MSDDKIQLSTLLQQRDELTTRVRDTEKEGRSALGISGSFGAFILVVILLGYCASPEQELYKSRVLLGALVGGFALVTTLIRKHSRSRRLEVDKAALQKVERLIDQRDVTPD